MLDDRELERRSVAVDVSERLSCIRQNTQWSLDSEARVSLAIVNRRLQFEHLIENDIKRYHIT